MDTSTVDHLTGSLALRDIPEPHFAEAQVIALPDGAPTDPSAWANAVFDFRRAPSWVVALLRTRQALVGLIGVDRNGPQPSDVVEVRGREALVAVDSRHLDFRAAVGVDPVAGYVWVMTTVRLHGWRGRVYFAPVRVLHSAVTFALLRAAARTLVARKVPSDHS